MNNCVFTALIATLGTWFITALGSATVLLFKNTSEKAMNFLIGFSAGVMISASFWSLLEPAIKKSEELSLFSPAVTVTSGFLLGAVFMYLCDKAVTLTQNKLNKENKSNNESLNKIVLLVLSITLHNIPEGLAIGVAFGALNKDSNYNELMSAASIAIGIGLQNFPEGAAVSLPLKREGISSGKSFFIGQASGMVEPIGGIIGSMLVLYVNKIMPYALSFAAGAMILVAVHELIPECRRNIKEGCYLSTMGIISGFAVMMFLDVYL